MSVQSKCFKYFLIEPSYIADVVYDPDVIPHFVKILKEVLCRKPGMVAYVASTVRNPDTFVSFRNELGMYY